MSINWLSIDTAMNACAVGVKTADGRIFDALERMDRGQAERLIPMIQDVVSQAGLTMPQIGAIAVTNGPGTFTGIRLGLATARALAQASGMPAIGVGTFEALAMAVPRRPVCILIETKRSDYYVRLFEGEKNHEGMCLSPDALRDYIRPDWLLAGDAVARAVAQTDCANETLELHAPHAADIIKLAEAELEKGQGATTALPQPVYLRPADVSIAKRRAPTIVQD